MVSSSKAAILKLLISPKAESILRRGHPWLFSDSVREISREGEVGELAVIYDRKDEFLGIGLYDPESPIRVRMLHVGKPQKIDHAFWQRKISEAVKRREALFDTQTTGYRISHGEGDRLPGLVLDRYGSTFVLKLYSAAWFPHLDQVLAAIRKEINPARLILRLSRNIQRTATFFGLEDGKILVGESLSGSVEFLESGLKFEADVIKGQKTGFFLDQRENRRMVEGLAKDRNVLNAFSFSGGFSLYAARGGAASVTDLDISAHAIESSKRNFALNSRDANIARCKHYFFKADVFKWLESQADQRFDFVILDPPSLAKRENERDGAIRAYQNLVKSAMGYLEPEGILFAASCSAHVSKEEFFDAVRKGVHQTKRKFTELQTVGHPPDHPIVIPEAEYLKGIYLKVN